MYTHTSAGALLCSFTSADPFRHWNMPSFNDHFPFCSVTASSAKDVSKTDVMADRWPCLVWLNSLALCRFRRVAAITLNVFWSVFPEVCHRRQSPYHSVSTTILRTVSHNCELSNPVQPIDSRAVVLIKVLSLTIVGSSGHFSTLVSTNAPSSQPMTASNSSVLGGIRLKTSRSTGVLEPPSAS